MMKRLLLCLLVFIIVEMVSAYPWPSWGTNPWARPQYPSSPWNPWSPQAYFAREFYDELFD